MEHPVLQFCNAMEAKGLTPPSIEADGQLHRFKSSDDKHPNSWYVFFKDPIPAGAFGCWKRNIKEQWCSRNISQLPHAEKQQVRQCLAHAKKAIRNTQLSLHNITSQRALKLWQRSQPTSNHPYLLKKNIKPLTARVYRKLLVIPLQDNRGKIWSLQFIHANGDKFFLKNGKKQGLFHALGDLSSDCIYICEGFATGCTLYEVTAKCVIIAFDANNLVPVSKNIRTYYPEKEIIICADNDQFTTGNPGLTKANEAAQMINAKVIYPIFTSLENKPTDFNDLCQQEGAQAVTSQLSNAVVAKNNYQNGFIINDEGVFYSLNNFDPDEPALKICSRLDIIARTRDENGLSHGRLLSFIDLDGESHQWAIPMEMLAGDGIEYRRILLSRGLEISSSKKARELLTNYILTSRPQQVALCVDKIGWHKHVFVLPDQTIGQCDEKIILQNKQLEASVYCRGTLTEWQRNIARYCEGNSRLIFAVSTAFAASLLPLLGEESGGFHFLGSSSIGKTTLLQLATSVWGGPERLQRWRATSNGIEAIAAMHNDSLLCLDEIGQVDGKEVGEIAYMLANGAGKGRCQRDGSMRKKSEWRLLFLSTGELSLADHINQGGKKIRAGQEVRLIDIPADSECGFGIFDDLHNFQSGAEFARYLSESTSQNFGTPIREFLTLVSEEINLVIKFINQRKSKFIKENVPLDADGQVQRVARRFALIAAVGELTASFGITAWQFNAATAGIIRCFKDWIKFRGGAGAKEPIFALAQVRHFFELHGESRFTPWDANMDQQKTINRAGFRKDGEFYVFPEAFKRDICEGINPRFVANLCVERGWLIIDGAGKAASTHRMPDTGTNRRVYHFSSKVFEDASLT